MSTILGGTIATYHPTSYNTEKKKDIKKEYLKGYLKKNVQKKYWVLFYNRANIIFEPDTSRFTRVYVMGINPTCGIRCSSIEIQLFIF